MVASSLDLPLLPKLTTSRCVYARPIALLLLGLLPLALAGPIGRARLHRPVHANTGRLTASASLLLRSTTSPRSIDHKASLITNALRPASLRPIAPGYSYLSMLHSEALGRNMNFWVYLPPGYHRSDRRYPVLYMLHGLHGNSSTWRAFGFFEQADRLMRDNQIAPLIIVTPQGDNGYWMNHVDNGPRYEDYVIDDVISHIDTTYRTLSKREYRAIGGVSMGGHGAIRLMLAHPDIFVAAGGHSPVFRDQAQAFPFYGNGHDYQLRDPVSLVSNLKRPVVGALFMDMGAQDTWLPRTQLFHQLLLSQGVQHSWQVSVGDHETSYWVKHIPTYLRWYDAALRGSALSSLRVAPSANAYN